MYFLVVCCLRRLSGRWWVGVVDNRSRKWGVRITRARSGPVSAVDSKAQLSFRHSETAQFFAILQLNVRFRSSLSSIAPAIEQLLARRTSEMDMMSCSLDTFR